MSARDEAAREVALAEWAYELTGAGACSVGESCQLCGAFRTGWADIDGAADTGLWPGVMAAGRAAARAYQRAQARSTADADA